MFLPSTVLPLPPTNQLTNHALHRLFLQPSSDDPTHDEALSSRVAALNMLDLGLEHLDVDVSGVASEGVGVVVRACGESEYFRFF